MGNPAGAALGGVVSHAILDLIPHNDVIVRNPETTVPIDSALCAVALAALGIHYGWGSAAFIGGLAGLAPDVEHAFVAAKITTAAQRLFPTHRKRTAPLGIGHGKHTRTAWSQAVLLGIGLAALLLR